MDPYSDVLDLTHPGARVDHGIARAESAQLMANLSYAQQLDAVFDVLSEAREFPEVFAKGAEVEFAERAAIADLAVRMSVAENTVRNQEHQARMMIGRLPQVWAAARDGLVSPAHLRVASELVAALPEDCWPAFDAGLLARLRLAPARFTSAARVLAGKLHTVDIVERHKTAMQNRRAWVDADVDGMAWLNAYLPAEILIPFTAWLDAEALKISRGDGESRTIAEIRADILSDLLIRKNAAGSVGVSVGVMVPVQTLMGLSEEPGFLEGYGPIDAETARRMAAKAPSFYRILTDPIRGTIVDIDRMRHDPPADLKRWIIWRDQLCTFPGCGRRAAACDLDHTQDWARGGTTSIMNISAVCRPHHTLKHKTLWTKRQRPDGSVNWTSPTGHTQNNDPPPY